MVEGEGTPAFLFDAHKHLQITTSMRELLRRPFKVNEKLEAQTKRHVCQVKRHVCHVTAHVTERYQKIGQIEPKPFIFGMAPILDVQETYRYVVGLFLHGPFEGQSDRLTYAPKEYHGSI